MDYREDSEKIPFDDEPILRNTSSRNRQKSSDGSSLSSFAKTIICLLIIANLVLGFLVVDIYSNYKKDSAVNEYIINNTSQSSSTSYATSKAVLSMVCVSAGTYTDTDGQVRNGGDLKYFYNVSSRGSGVIFKDYKNSGTAYIVTNYHVVSADLNNIYVLLYGSQFPIVASFVGSSATKDIAVLKIDNSTEYKRSASTACTVADSSLITIGDTCVAIGNPIAMGISASTGNVSVPYEFIAVEGSPDPFRVIRTDAAINSGNSGGGLFDEFGNLIGVVNAKISNAAVENIAFAIPSNLAISIANNILRNSDQNETGGILKKATIGVTFEIDSSRSVFDTETSKTKIEYNIRVTDIKVNSLASSCGLQVDDEIVSFTYDGKTIDMDYLFAFEDNIYNMDPGTEIVVKVKRLQLGTVVEVDKTFTLQNSDFSIVA